MTSRAPVRDLLPLSSTQQQMRFEEQIRPGSTAYHMPEIFRVTGPLDTAALQQAVDTVVSRHAALRLVFPDLGGAAGAPAQRLLPARAVKVAVATTVASPEVARAMAVSEAMRPFDLARGPLLRILAIRTGGTEQLLVLTVHHLISDGWSLSILHEELTAAYAAASAGLRPGLPQLSRQFPDAVRDEHERLDAQAVDRLVGWWRDYLADTPTVLGLPADYERTAGAARRSARCGLLIDQARSNAVRALGRAHESTLFMTLLSALGLVLSRQTGQERLLIGSPVSTRRAADRAVVGCFLNTLPLRLDAGGDPSFSEFLGRVRRSALDALAHQDVPFHRLAGQCGAGREPGHSPLIQAFFNVVPAARELVLANCATQRQAFPEIDAKFDLTLYAADHNGQLALDAVYDAALYQDQRIADLLGQLASALDQAVAEPGRRIGTFALATGRAAQLTRPPCPAGPALPPPGPGSLLERLAEHARQRPWHPALDGPGGTCGYRELAARVEVLAGRLTAQGAGRGDVVAVRAARDPAVVVAMLAALRVSAAFALLDADYPAAELRARAALLKPAAWIDAAAGHLAAPLGAPVIDASEDGPAGTRPAAGAFRPSSPDDDGYVAFTSGTTGRPRQVVGTHGPLTHFLDWYTRGFGVTPADRFSVLSGIGHDPFLRDVLAPLWAGATAVFPDADVRDSAALAEALRRQEVTIAHLTPALADSLASAPAPGWPALRLAGFGGDVLTRRTLREWAELAPGADLLNLYGATETPQAVSVHLARRAGQPVPPGTGRVPLGPGIDGVQLLVLAGDMPAAIGELGEIVVRTRHLARYADSPPGGLAGEYRTGDLGRLRPDGLVDFAGRADRQVKVRGYRVEPAEIEAVLTGWPGVRQCVVLASPQERGGHRLVACLAVGTGPRPDLAGLRTALSARLASYQVPADFVVAGAFPLTAQGKIDHAALLRLDQQTAVAAYVAPRTALERQLARLWGQLLGRGKIGAHDDFFALGGHSLLLSQVRVRIREDLGADVTLRGLFEHPTIAALAVLIGQSRRVAPQRPVPRAAETEPAPLSWTQQRIWLEDQLRPGDTAYNMPLVLHLRGPLDEAALQRAVSAAVRRHAVLRSRVFVPDGDGLPVQQVRPGVTVTIRRLDLAAAPETAYAEAMHETRQPFDLSAGPLLRALLARTGADEHLLVLTAHHIAFDGWSFSVLLDAISQSYRAALRRRPAGLHRGLNFADVARWQRAGQDDPALDRHAAWWRKRLAGWPAVLDLPTDRPRPPVQAHRGARRRLEIDPETTRRLRQLARSHHSTLFMILLSGFGAVLSRWAGQERLLVGTPVASRDRTEFEDVVGCFINTVPIPVDLRGGPRFRELLGRVTDSALGAFANQAVPFGTLVSDLAQRDLSRSPLIQVLFALQNMRTSVFQAPGVSCEPVEIGEANVQFDLNLRMLDTGDAITGWLDYDTALFDAETAGRLSDHLIRLIRGVAADPAAEVTSVALLGPADRHRVLTELNAAAAPRWPAGTLTTLLDQQARRSPERVAVRCGGTQLSYAGLHRRAERLAQRLREHGVGPETVVGVHLERSAELVIALLAVLKAGGAYLPLDPGYPGQRLAFMLSDAAVPVVLTAPGSDLQLAEGSVTVLNVSAQAGRGRPRVRLPAAEPENLAYVIYTSGSTGRPKGVQVPHRGIVNRLLGMQEAYRLRAGDTVLQKTPISFDVSVWELFWPLLAGARLVLAEPGGHRDPAYLARLIHDQRVTVCHFVPAMLHAFLDARPAELCASLRLVVCSGEALPAGLARRFHRTLPDCDLENLYGPTEASVDVTSWSCRADWDRSAVPIGRPVAGTRAYVLDRRMAPLPVGIPGELYLGGVQLARAYGGRPGLTAGRFVADPLSVPGARLYRTGDLARWRPDGVLEYLGRADRQVKVRGFRVEPGEIEAALVSQPGVAQAVVTVREDQPGERRIIAYLTAAPAPAAGARTALLPEPAALRAGLARTLPDHMIPAAFVPLPALPLDPNGKVDYPALPAPPPGPAGRTTPYIAPRTAAERQIAALWREVLNRDRVGVTDNFFELGGDSMHAIRITGLAREQGLDITSAELFTHQTVEAMAASLAARADPAEPCAQPPPVAAFGLLAPSDLARLQVP
jgi:amino acid adenylation domain-containing protein